MFISVKGFDGKFNAIVDWFYKENLDHLKEIISIIYRDEYDEEIPSEFHEIKTIKALKEFVKEEMSDMDSYPYGFKNIEGTFAVYRCI